MQSEIRLPIFVAVYMITYNHENYIKNAIDSVLMQKTNFSFKLFIGEDFSTDRTREICVLYKNKFPEKIELLLQDKNIGAVSNAHTVFNTCRKSGAKYIAMLEGDDNWKDSYKLQRQIDFLEANPKISLCSHDYSIINENNDILETSPLQDLVQKYQNGFEFSIDSFFKRWITKTVTVLFRTSALDLDFSTYTNTYDVIIFFNILTNGNGYWMNFNGANYRVHESNSWFHDNRVKKFEKEYNSFKELYQHYPGYQVLLNGMLRNNYYVIRQIWQEHNFVNMPYKKLAGYSFTFIKNIVSHKNSYKYFLSKLLGSKKSGDDKLKVNT